MRHGTSTFNLERRVQGHCDLSNLTEEGRIGAAQVGVALRGLKFDAVYSSPLQRAKETAEIILTKLEPAHVPAAGLQQTDLLKEINLLQWEGMSFDEVKQLFPEQYQDWRDRPHDLQMDRLTRAGKESFFPVRDLYEQAQHFWQEVLPRHPDQTLLVVAHSGINRSLITSAIGLSPEHYKTFDQANCCISVLNFAEGIGQPVQLESVNLTAHLGKNLPKCRLDSGIRLLLVRHGETEWNRQKKFQGQIDVPLNQRGREQSETAATFLSEVMLDRIITSPMLRPKETAEIIQRYHPQVKIELDETLKEIAHGLWEGKLEAEIEQQFPQELQQWKRSPETVQMPDGENLQQVWQRAIAGWQAILTSTPVEPDRMSTVLVVAHDAINKAILCDLVGLGPEHFWTFKQGNCAVSVIDYANAQSKPQIQALNITSHLNAGVLDKTAAGAL